jgi:hypothetical protein
MYNLPRNLLLLAAVFAIIASVQAFTFTTEVREWILDPEGAYEEIYQESFYQRDGPAGVSLLFIISLFYYAPYYFYRNQNLRLSAFFALLAITLTYLTEFTIGPNYLPAAGALILGYIVMGLFRLSQKTS